MPAPNWTYTEIEDAVLDALADLKKANGGPALTVEAYQGELAVPEALVAALGRFPAVFVTILGSTYSPPESAARGTQEQVWRVVCFVGARSWRSKDDAAPGVYDLLGLVRARLAGKTLGLTGVRQCYPRSEELQTNPDPSIVIYRAEYWLTNPRFTWV